MTASAARGRRWIGVSAALSAAIASALAAACDAPKPAPRDEDSASPREKPRDDLAIVDAASKLADDGDYVSAHATLLTLSATSDALDDPRVARIETGWAQAIFERVTRGGLADGGRADLERVAAAPRIPSDARMRALDMLSKIPSAATAELALSAPPRSSTGPANEVSSGNVADVHTTVSALTPKFKACYDVELSSDPTLKGSVRLTLKLGPKGEVLGPPASSPSPLPPRMVDCLKSVLVSAPFSRPDGVNATIVLPLTFQPAP